MNRPLGDASNRGWAMSERLTDIRDDRAKLSAIFDALSDGVVICDLSGEVAEINDTACELLATGRHLAIGQKLGRLSSTTEETLRPALAWLERAELGSTASFEWDCRTAKGRAFWAEVTLRRITLGDHPLGLAVIRDITERKRLIATLIEGTRRDPLTGLPDRRDLDDILPYELARYERYGGYLCIALGHVEEVHAVAADADLPISDASVCGAAEFLRGRLRKSDYVGRIGQDEFVLLIHDTRPDIAARMLNRLRLALLHVEAAEINHALGISFGLTGYRLGDTPEDMLTRLREALALARTSGHHRVVTA